MAIDLNLFSGANYQSTIIKYCNQLGWSISDINNSRTILRFEADSGITQTVFIIRYEDTLEFSCPSGLKFKNRQSISDGISTYLLCENSKYKIGFWAIEEINDKLVFSIMHNAEISLIDLHYFKAVVTRLFSECDKFEQAFSQALNN